MKTERKNFPILLTLVAVFLLLVSSFELPQPVRAGANHNLRGFAWADIPGSFPGAGGWISFNSLDTGSAVNYGVNVEDSGLVTGYAWSDIPNSVAGSPMGVGWISFNPGDLAGCPFGPCEARVDTTNGNVSGWARALAGMNAEAGGWDGWISLRDFTNVSYPGVAIGSCGWQGWAWGGSVVGWISFSSTTDSGTPNGVNYQVTGMANCTSTAQLRIVPSGPVTLIQNLNPTVQLRAWYDEDGAGPIAAQDVTDDAGWISSDDSIVSVAGGELTANAVGNVIITATYFLNVRTEATVITNVLPEGEIKEIPPES